MVGLERVRTNWRLTGPLEFPGLKTDAAAWIHSCDGLSAFFEACAAERSGKTVAMPSLAADAVWHAWLRADPGNLDAFCRARYGRTFSHQTKGEMHAPMADALARCWVNNCHAEGCDPLDATIPSLFKLDASLGIPGGWAYHVDRQSGRVRHAQIGADGRPDQGTVKEAPSLTAAGMFAAGAIGQYQFDAWMAVNGNALVAQKRATPAPGSCGSGSGSGCGCGVGTLSSDGGGGGGGDGDGGGDSGGGSCGGGCGGGCGGD
jgi:hypothetical protein